MRNPTHSACGEYYEAFLQSRKQYYRAWIRSIIIYIIVQFVFYRLGFFNLLYAQSLWPIVVVVPAVALRPMVSKVKVDAQKKYKKMLVWSAREKVFSDLQLQSEGKFSYAELQAAGLNADVDATQNDWFRGNCNGISFAMCDVAQWRFQGRILIAELDKAFSQRITLVQKGFPENKKDTENLQTVVIDNSIFMDTFQCYAENAEKAKEILMPQIVQAVSYASAATDGSLHITFCGYRIFVSVHDNQGAFKPPLFRKFDLEKEMESVYTQIHQIANLMETVTRMMHKENLQSTD